jgi:hypothetical protein
MSTISRTLTGVVGAGLTLTAAGTSAQQDGADDTTPPAAYTVDLEPLNNSGVSGRALLGFSGGEGGQDQLTVFIAAQRLEAGQEHPQHIHSRGGGSNARCPALAADQDGDNLVSVEEGAPAYGDIALALEPFPTVGDGQRLVFVQTYMLGDGQMDDDTTDGATDGTISRDQLEPLENRVIVLHGLTVPGQGYVATLPVACGQIEPLFEPAGDGDGEADDGPDDTDEDDADDMDDGDDTAA